MDKNKGVLRDFARLSESLDMTNKLKLALFSCGVKPNTAVTLKFTPKTFHEERQFDRLLLRNKIIQIKNDAKAFSNLIYTKNGKIVPQLDGVKITYNLFSTHFYKYQYEHLTQLLQQNNHKKADKIIGKLYGYPRSDVSYFEKFRDPNHLKKRFSYKSYYKHLHDSKRIYPYIFHRPKTLENKETKKLNDSYKDYAKNFVPIINKKYNEIRKVVCPLVVHTLTDIEHNGKRIWDEKDGYHYTLVSTKKIDGEHKKIPYLSKREYEIGEILQSEITFRHDYADVHIL